MNLIDVYDDPLSAKLPLYELLDEREPHESISHRALPSWPQHCAFVNSRPYEAWYLIQCEGVSVGSVYLTPDDEIGIAVFKAYRRQGIGKAAIKKLMQMHPRSRYLANINPDNQKSQELFAGLGFTPLQITYEIQGDSSNE